MENTQNVITVGIFDDIFLRINQSSTKVREHNETNTLLELNIIKLRFPISICIVPLLFLFKIKFTREI